MACGTIYVTESEKVVRFDEAGWTFVSAAEPTADDMHEVAQAWKRWLEFGPTCPVPTPDRRVNNDA